MMVILLIFAFGIASSVALSSYFTSEDQNSPPRFKINSTNNVWVHEIEHYHLLSEPMSNLVLLILVFIAAAIVAILPILLTLRF